MWLVDTHCHLFLEDYREDLAQVMERARLAGLKLIINIGLDAASSLAAIEQARALNKAGAGLSAARPELLAAVGWHPHEAALLTEESLGRLAELAGYPEVAAFGEIGLDFFRDHSPRDAQRSAFDKLLDLGLITGLPLVFHVREAHRELLEFLSRRRDKLTAGIIHCFSGDWLIARKYLDLGLHLSLPGVLTFPRAVELHEVAKKAPPERLLLETDGPFLAPVPFRGRRNEPAFIKHTLSALADLTGRSEHFWARQTTANAEQLFKQPPSKASHIGQP